MCPQISMDDGAVFKGLESTGAGRSRSPVNSFVCNNSAPSVSFNERSSRVIMRPGCRRASPKERNMRSRPERLRRINGGRQTRPVGKKRRCRCCDEIPACNFHILFPPLKQASPHYWHAAKSPPDHKENSTTGISTGGFSRGRIK